MKLSDITDPYMLAPTKTVEGKPWIQRCYVCRKSVNFLKDFPHQYVKVGPLVRHRKCRPQ